MPAINDGETGEYEKMKKELKDLISKKRNLDKNLVCFPVE
jgi:hypothetical protein